MLSQMHSYRRQLPSALDLFRKAVRRFVEAVGDQEIKCNKAPPSGAPDNVIWPQQAAPQEWKTKLIEKTLPNRKQNLEKAIQYLQAQQPNTVPWACARDKVKVAGEHLKFSLFRLQTLLKFAELNTLANPKQQAAHATVQWGLQQLPGIAGEVNQLLSKAEHAAGVKLKHIGVRTSDKEAIKYGHAKANQVLDAIKDIYKDDPEALKKELDFFSQAQALGASAPEPTHDTPQPGVTPAEPEPDKPAHQTEPHHEPTTLEPVGAPQETPPEAAAETPAPEAPATTVPVPEPLPVAKAPQPSPEPAPVPAPEPAPAAPAAAFTSLAAAQKYSKFDNAALSGELGLPADAPVDQVREWALQNAQALGAVDWGNIHKMVNPVQAKVAEAGLALTPQQVKSIVKDTLTAIHKADFDIDDATLNTAALSIKGAPPGSNIDQLRSQILKDMGIWPTTSLVKKAAKLAPKATAQPAPAPEQPVVPPPAPQAAPPATAPAPAPEKNWGHLNLGQQDQVMAVLKQHLQDQPDNKYDANDLPELQQQIAQQFGVKLPTDQISNLLDIAGQDFAPQPSTPVPAGLAAIAPSAPQSVMPPGTPEEPAKPFTPAPPPPSITAAQSAQIKAWAKAIIQHEGKPPADLNAQLIEKAQQTPNFGPFDPNYVAAAVHSLKASLAKSTAKMTPAELLEVEQFAKQELANPEGDQADDVGLQIKLMKAKGFWIMKHQAIQLMSKVKEMGPDPVSLSALPPAQKAEIGNHAKTAAVADGYALATHWTESGDMDSETYKATLKEKIEKKTLSMGLKLFPQDYEDLATNIIDANLNQSLSSLSPEQLSLAEQTAKHVAAQVGEGVTPLDLKKAMKAVSFVHLNSAALTGLLEKATQEVFKPDEAGYLAEIAALIASAPKEKVIPVTSKGTLELANEMATTAGTEPDLVAKYHIKEPGALSPKVKEIGLAEAKKRYDEAGAINVMIQAFEELWNQGKKINKGVYTNHALGKKTELATFGFSSETLWEVASKSYYAVASETFDKWFHAKDSDPKSYSLPAAFKAKVLQNIVENPGQLSHLIAQATGLSKMAGKHHAAHTTWPKVDDKPDINVAIHNAIVAAGGKAPAQGVLKGIAVLYKKPLAYVKSLVPVVLHSPPSPTFTYGGGAYSTPTVAPTTPAGPATAAPVMPAVPVVPKSLIKSPEQILGLDLGALEKFVDLAKPPTAPTPPPSTAFTKHGKGEIGGYHAKWTTGQDDLGFRWMFKPEPSNKNRVIAYAEVAANRTQALLGLPTVEHIWFESMDDHVGSLHYYRPEADFGREEAPKLKPHQASLAKDIQKLGISNWIVSDFDGHGANMVVMNNPSPTYADQKGHLMAIDHGQAGKFLGQDQFNLDYNPNQGVEKIEHHLMFKAWAAGADIPIASLMDPEILDIFDRAEAIPSEMYRKLWKPYCDSREEMSGASSAKLLDMLDKRRMTARSDVAKLYRDAIDRRVKWKNHQMAVASHPFDAEGYRQELLNALGVPQFEALIAAQGLGPIAAGKVVGKVTAPETAESGDVDILKSLSPADQARRTPLGVPKMEVIQKLGIKGLDMLVGGDQIRDSKISFWALGDQAFAEMTLTPKAARSIENRLPEHATTVKAPKLTNPKQIKVQQLNQQIFTHDLEKHFNYWASGLPSGVTNPSGAGAGSKYAKLKYFHAAYLAAQKLASSTDKLESAVGQHYVAQFKKLGSGTPNEELALGHKVPLPDDGYKLNDALPTDERKLELFELPPEELPAEAEKPLAATDDIPACGPNTPPPCAEKLNYTPFPRAVAKSLKGLPDQSAELLDGELSTQGGGLDGKNGISYRIKLGNGVTLNYVPRYNGKAAGSGVQGLHARKGRIRIEFDKNVPMTDEVMQQALDSLKTLGVDIKHATRDDAELEYLRQMAWLTKLTGAEITGALKMPPNLSKKQQIETYINAFKQRLNYDPRFMPQKNASGQIIGSTNVPNPSYRPIPEDVGGKFSFRRFDISDDDIKKMIADGYCLFAETSGEALYSMALNGLAMSYERRIQRGLPYTGWSNASDVGSGGSKEVYLRVGKKRPLKHGEWQISPELLAFTHVYSQGGDSYGNKNPALHYRSPAMRAKNLQEELEEALSYANKDGQETLPSDVVDLDRFLIGMKVGGSGTFGGLNLNDHHTGASLKQPGVTLNYSELLQNILTRLKAAGQRSFGGIQVLDDNWEPIKDSPTKMAIERIVRE